MKNKTYLFASLCALSFAITSASQELKLREQKLLFDQPQKFNEEDQKIQMPFLDVLQEVSTEQTLDVIDQIYDLEKKFLIFPELGKQIRDICGSLEDIQKKYSTISEQINIPLYTQPYKKIVEVIRKDNASYELPSADALSIHITKFKACMVAFSDYLQEHQEAIKTMKGKPQSIVALYTNIQERTLPKTQIIKSQYQALDNFTQIVLEHLKTYILNKEVDVLKRAHQSMHEAMKNFMGLRNSVRRCKKDIERLVAQETEKGKMHTTMRCVFIAEYYETVLAKLQTIEKEILNLSEIIADFNRMDRKTDDLQSLIFLNTLYHTEEIEQTLHTWHAFVKKMQKQCSKGLQEKRAFYCHSDQAHQIISSAKHKEQFFEFFKDFDCLCKTYENLNTSLDQFFDSQEYAECESCCKNLSCFENYSLQEIKTKATTRAQYIKSAADIEDAYNIFRNKFQEHPFRKELGTELNNEISQQLEKADENTEKIDALILKSFKNKQWDSYLRLTQFKGNALKKFNSTIYQKLEERCERYDATAKLKAKLQEKKDQAGNKSIQIKIIKKKN